jgi:C1A family cysteine protease
MTLYKVDDWGFANSSGDQGQSVTPTADIKAAIMAYGCVGAAIAADDAFMNNPAGRVFDRTTSQGIDHDIILVGWDDTKGHQGAWLLRNSWGSSWCDGGYCWIGYGVNLVGTEAVWAVVKSTAPPIDWGSL